MAFTEVPSSCANWLWVFPNWRRIVENSFLSTEAFLQVRYLYHDVAHVKGFLSSIILLERHAIKKILERELDIRSTEVKFFIGSTTLWYMQRVT
jgi:hypothetical protein